MNIKISNKIEISDTISESVRGGDRVNFDWSYYGTSNEDDTTMDDKDFLFSNANKFVYELKHGNTFDLLLQQDVIKCDSTDNISSIHIFCYESTSINRFKKPIRFDLFLEDLNISLGKMSEFSLGNLKELSSDIRISGVDIPIDSKATLIIILAVNED